jgi:hypothetical protein
VSLTYDTGDVDESRIPVVGGATQQSRGAYLTISRRTNGAWLIAEQVWTGQTAAETLVVKQGNSRAPLSWLRALWLSDLDGERNASGRLADGRACRG